MGADKYLLYLAGRVVISFACVFIFYLFNLFLCPAQVIVLSTEIGCHFA